MGYRHGSVCVQRRAFSTTMRLCKVSTKCCRWTYMCPDVPPTPDAVLDAVLKLQEAIGDGRAPGGVMRA